MIQQMTKQEREDKWKMARELVPNASNAVCEICQELIELWQRERLSEDASGKAQAD